MSPRPEGFVGIRSHLKDDKSPVTVADFASQAVIARALAENLKGVRLVAEETADVLPNGWQRAMARSSTR